MLHTRSRSALLRWLVREILGRHQRYIDRSLFGVSASKPQTAFSAKAAQGAAAGCPPTQDMLPRDNRDTRIVGQDLWRSVAAVRGI